MMSYNRSSDIGNNNDYNNYCYDGNYSNDNGNDKCNINTCYDELNDKTETIKSMIDTND